MITELFDDNPPVLVLYPENGKERDRLLETLRYPRPARPEDWREGGLQLLANYDVRLNGGRAGYGVVVLELERLKASQRGLVDPRPRFLPLRVARDEIVTAEDLKGMWHFVPSRGSKAEAFQMMVASLSGETTDEHSLGIITGEWRFLRAGNPTFGFTGSADRRTSVFMFVLTHDEMDIRVVGSFTARDKAIATYTAWREIEPLIGQVEGMKIK